MVPGISRKTKITGFVLLIFSAIFFSSGAVAKVTPFNQTFDVSSRYEGYIYNSTFVEVAIVLNISVEENGYTSNVASFIGFNEELIDLLNESLVLDSSIAETLPEYDIGIRDSSWMNDRPVYSVFGNLTRVYSTRTCLLVLLQGNVDIGGLLSRVFVISVSEMQVQQSPNLMTMTTTTLLVIFFIVMAIIFVYVYFFKERRYIKSQEKKIMKTGRKRENLIKKKTERVQKSTGKKKAEKK